MSDIAIQFDNVGKLYKLGLVGTGSLVHDLNRWWKTSILSQEDPYLKIGETNDRSKKGSSDYVWALKNITFDVKQGDVVGIIGKNGAGKSTLLKLLSRVTSPSTGAIRAKGRIASLLEVGTGFHPELTGRENIYMNGSIMGMTRHEIDRKLDEIVDFAGVERYIDTPVKRYSSGMTVRLGFAVAAFLEPEILVVDEVLAVGDAEFQKKAIGKMQDVSKGEGRTVLFVSHNMAAVKSLCSRGIVLKNGMINYMGGINDSVNYYIENEEKTIEEHIIHNIEWTNPIIKIEELKINNSDLSYSFIANKQDCFNIHIIGESKEDVKLNISFTLTNKDGIPLIGFDPINSKGEFLNIKKGHFSINKNIKLPLNLSKGILKMDLYMHHPGTSLYLKAPHCCILECEGSQQQYCKSLDISINGIIGLEEIYL